MKTFKCGCTCLLLLCAIVTFGQELQYSRSSLARVMVFHPEDEFCYNIAQVFDTMAMPDKYFDHNVGIKFIDFDAFYGLKNSAETYTYRSQDPNQIKINEQVLNNLKEHNLILESVYYNEILKESYCSALKIDYVAGTTTWDDVIAAFNALSDKMQKKVRDKLVPKGLNKAKYGKVLNKNEVEVNALALEKILNENQYAKRLVAKWFNLQGNTAEDATFDMSTVFNRGDYSVSDIDIAKANMQANPQEVLRRLSAELVDNTYVLVNDITYVTTEEKAAAGKVAVSILGTLFNVLGAAAGVERDIVNVKAINKSLDDLTGFDVRTHSYLFQLVWDEETQGMFENNHWNNVQAFLDDQSTYKLKYVAHAYEADKKTIGDKANVNRNEYIKYICTRSIDKNIAALQQVYEDFKVKERIIDVVQDKKKVYYTAKIGLKEGISNRSKFQVVKAVQDPKTGKLSYRYVATLKPVKGKLWDNRYYMAGDRPENDLGATYFTKVVGGEILPGMIIIEGKYRKVQGGE